jgi:hypothetical protein
VVRHCTFCRRLFVLDEKILGGYYNAWAKHILKAHARGVRRLYRAYNVDALYRVYRTRRAKTNRMSKNARNKVKMGIEVPRNTREALFFDKQNKNTLWADAIFKEMSGLRRLNVFKFHAPNYKCDRKEGWQFAPMHMIFDIKQQDMRFKARLIVGGHVIDSSDYTTYSSVIENLSVRLLFLAAAHQGLGIMTGDIGNAFPTAPCAEKVWSKCGPEFGAQEGAIATLQWPLYGLKIASRSFHEFFGDTLQRMGFTPTRADQDLWYRKADDHAGFEYIATHVDDIAIAATRPAEYMNMIEQDFLVRNKEDSPSYYLGNDLKMKGDRLRKYQEEHRTLPKKNTPMSPNAHPELDTSDLLDEPGIRHYQKIIGMGQWLVVAGRFDINYAISSLSRYAAAPQKGHLEMAEDILGSLKKYPAHGYIINPKPPSIDPKYETIKLKEDFSGQYQYFQEEDLDPKFPEPLVPEMDINIFVDANHAHNKVMGRSVTRLFCFVGSTPVSWRSKRQASVQTSTFGAEFTALKKAVKEGITLRYYLRSMGIKVAKSTPFFVDNMGVVLNASNPGSTFNKKSVALLYHFV